MKLTRNTQWAQMKVNFIPYFQSPYYFTIFLCFFLFISSSEAQYFQFPLKEKINHSDLILEGKVVGQFTFKKDGRIYTANQIEVCDIIFNQNLTLANKNLFVITYGGNYNGEFYSWPHTLQLSKNTEGLFFLKTNSTILPDPTNSDNIYFQPFGQEQGFIMYSKDDDSNFRGNSLFTNISNPNTYIQKINNISNQSLISESCLWK
jgi:hypothetical protein